MQLTLHAEFTAHLVEQAEPPASGQRFIRDTLQSRLALRITSAGTKAYIIEAWVNNRSRRLTLGKHPALTLRDARRMAKQALGTFAQGRDLVAERQTRRARDLTLGEVFESYLKGRDLKPGTVHDYRRILRGAFADWAHKPIAEITRDMVERRHNLLVSAAEREQITPCACCGHW